MRGEAEIFVEQAEADLERAGANMEEDGWYAAVFFAQQAVERYFKALDILKLKELVKTHDVVKLGQRLGAPEEVLTAARAFNHDYAATRYPDVADGVPARQYDETIAAEHIDSAKKVIEWAKREIGRGTVEKGRRTCEARGSAEEFAGRVAEVLDLNLALLFGSRVRDDWLVDSDWDVILVSRDFEGVEFVERVRRVSHLWQGDSLDLLCYTPEELEGKKQQIGTVATAVAEGIVVWKKGG